MKKRYVTHQVTCEVQNATVRLNELWQHETFQSKPGKVIDMHWQHFTTPVMADSPAMDWVRIIITVELDQ